MTEFLKSDQPDALTRFHRRIDREMSRRIQAVYPLQDQNFILISLLAHLIGKQGSDHIKGNSSEEYMFARDRTQASAFIDCVIKHRHAALALKELVNSNKHLVNQIDLTESKWWKDAEPET